MVVAEREGVVNKFPVDKTLPPVAAAYHFIVAPLDGVADRLTVPVLQREPLINELMDGDVAMPAITAVLADVQPLADASTKYVVLVEIIGVVYEVPVASEAPPVEAAYQFNVPVDVAPNVTEPVPQLDAGVVEATVGIALMVATTAERAELHPLLMASAK